MIRLTLRWRQVKFLEKGVPRLVRRFVDLRKVAAKVEPLEVAFCHASRACDKRRILDLIVKSQGSLQNMDRKIKALISSVLLENFKHANARAASLLEQRGKALLSERGAYAEKAAHDLGTEPPSHGVRHQNSLEHFLKSIVNPKKGKQGLRSDSIDQHAAACTNSC